MRRVAQVKDIQGKINKARRSLDVDEPPLPYAEDFLEGHAEKPRYRMIAHVSLKNRGI